MTMKLSLPLMALVVVACDSEVVEGRYDRECKERLTDPAQCWADQWCDWEGSKNEKDKCRQTCETDDDCQEAYSCRPAGIWTPDQYDDGMTCHADDE